MILKKSQMSNSCTILSLEQKKKWKRLIVNLLILCLARCLERDSQKVPKSRLFLSHVSIITTGFRPTTEWTQNS